MENEKIEIPKTIRLNIDIPEYWITNIINNRTNELLKERENLLNKHLQQYSRTKSFENLLRKLIKEELNNIILEETMLSELENNQ